MVPEAKFGEIELEERKETRSLPATTSPTAESAVIDLDHYGKYSKLISHGMGFSVHHLN